MLAAYGFAVNLRWRGDFSKLLGLYVVLFFVVRPALGRFAEAERIFDPPRLVGGP
jgi:hypothetical protein